MFLVFTIFFCLSNGYETNKRPALGQPYSLGDLYDAHTDQVIKGEKPWLEKDIELEPIEYKPHTTAKLISDQELDTKTAALGLDAELTASFLSGQVEVSGAAEFLTEKSPSHYEASVSYIYESQTYYKQMSEKTLQKPMYPKVLGDWPDATHVVTGILYGANAVFKLKEQLKSTNDRTEVMGKLSIAAEFSVAMVKGHAGANFTDDERKNLSKIDCEFHGDVILLDPPVTAAQAIDSFSKLGKMIMDQNQSVPVEVRIVPIGHIGTEEDRIYENVKASLLSSFTKRVGEYDELHKDIGDILISDPYDSLKLFKQKVDELTDAITAQENRLKLEAAKLLPSIRNGSEGAPDQLSALIRESQTLFTFEVMKKCIQIKLSEKGALSHLASYDPKLIVNKGDIFNGIVTDPDLTYVVIFAVQLYKSFDLYSHCVQQDCEKNPMSIQCQNYNCGKSIPCTTWATPEILPIIKKKFALFKRNVIANENEAVKSGGQRKFHNRHTFRLPSLKSGLKSTLAMFIIHKEEIDENTSPHFSTQIYEGGTKVVDNFEFPTIMLTVNQTCLQTSITWKVSIANVSLVDKWLKSVTVQYHRLMTNKTARVFKRRGLKLEDKMTIPLGENFAVDILVYCSFGICLNHSKSFDNCKNSDVCDSSPCQNGGSCSVAANGFTCRCTAAWTGQSCTRKNCKKFTLLTKYLTKKPSTTFSKEIPASDYIMEGGEGNIRCNARPIANVVCNDGTWISGKCTEAVCFQYFKDVTAGVYWVSDSQTITWMTGRPTCQNTCSDYASFHSAKESGFSSNLNGPGAWIGLVPPGNVWVDGSPFDFNGFAPGQPTNIYRKGSYSCYYSGWPTANQWDDTNCYDNWPFPNFHWTYH